MVDEFADCLGDFTNANATAREKDCVHLDEDVAAWLRKQGDMSRQVNDLCRFYMDTTLLQDAEFDMEAFEQSQAIKPPDGPSR